MHSKRRYRSRCSLRTVESSLSRISSDGIIEERCIISRTNRRLGLVSRHAAGTRGRRVARRRKKSNFNERRKVSIFPRTRSAGNREKFNRFAVYTRGWYPLAGSRAPRSGSRNRAAQPIAALINVTPVCTSLAPQAALTSTTKRGFSC